MDDHMFYNRRRELDDMIVIENMMCISAHLLRSEKPLSERFFGCPAFTVDGLVGFCRHRK